MLNNLQETIAVQFPSIRSLLLHDPRIGRLTFENQPNASRELHRLASIAKSFTALLVGCAIKDGFFKSPDDVLLASFPRLVTGDSASYQGTSLTHLFTMTSGMVWNESELDAWAWSPEPKFPMRVEVAQGAVGTFSYNTGGSHLAGAILAEIVGHSLDMYARQSLLTPLGIEEIAWAKDPQGYCFGGHAIQLRPVDLLNIGCLLLTNGTHGGVQLLPEWWAQTCATPRAPGNWPFELPYGFSWWVTSWGCMAFGYGGQILALNPSLQRVLVVTSDKDALHEEYYARLVDPLMS